MPQKQMSLILKELFDRQRRKPEKNAGGKNEGKCHYVIENTCRKNVRNRSSHYVFENKDT
jgi:hypothetical protein